MRSTSQPLQGDKTTEDAILGDSQRARFALRPTQACPRSARFPSVALFPSLIVFRLFLSEILVSPACLHPLPSHPNRRVCNRQFSIIC